MSELGQRCAATLRELRKKRGLTLGDCEKISEGELKAVVLGSYERGSRAISIAKLEYLAHFYGVPVTYFFDDTRESSFSDSIGLRFDLRKMRSKIDSGDSLALVRQYLAKVVQMRGDWNGELLTTRASDFLTLALLANVAESDLLHTLKDNNYLFNQ